MLNKFSELAMGFDSVIFDVIEEWGDDLMTVIGANAPNKDDTRSISTFSYTNSDSENSNIYTLLENGEVYRVSMKTVDDGMTWNGDDVYVKAHKKIITYHEKIGQIEIDDIDYSDDENIENVVCQLIECMRDNG